MKVRTTIGVALISAGLVGCATSEPYRPEGKVTVPDAYVSDFRPSVGDVDLWWQGFDDPALNALVSRALERNLTIAAARKRLKAARALVTAERSDRAPSVDGYGEAALSGDTDGASETDAGAGADFLLDLDLPGRLSLEVEAAAANARANAYFVADQRRVIAAAVASQYVELRRTQARLALLEESTTLQRRTLQIVEDRFSAGLSANLDVRRAAADLAQTTAQAGILRLQRAQAANALSVLTSDTPSPIPGTAASGDIERLIPRYDGGPPLGLPANLLRRRPDLLVAEARLAEAAANVGIERADLYPSLVLPGRIGTGGGGFEGLLGNLIGSVGASLDLPLFDGGRRRAEIAAARAEADARFDEYRRSVLEVLAEVENSLVAIESYQSRINSLEDAIDQSREAYTQLNALYREGLSSLFDVLDAQRQLIASRQSLIDSEADLANAVIDFYAAVGSPNGEALELEKACSGADCR
ncbi:efflux transporter outer membrane subunit [Stakelama saccharophila]|uniref:Efflux transporter outer membrane subunit n=1 Tax=Stakelama saccharophila TaxID=3075605 RepID=A0ABZ0B9G6_9SPHN|nr:efflux transporter outer membrane subunit [Stakelama sp. W311]WNO54050.1 efflux transporter outer membrane subunit [Stakelama sp. W311]